MEEGKKIGDNSYNETFDFVLDKNDKNNITCLINKTNNQNNYTINYINFIANQNIQNAILKKITYYYL